MSEMGVQFGREETHPVGDTRAEPRDPPEFRRFLDPTVKCSVRQRTWARCDVPFVFCAALEGGTTCILVSRTLAETCSTADSKEIQSLYTTRSNSTHDSSSSISSISAIICDETGEGWRGKEQKVSSARPMIFRDGDAPQAVCTSAVKYRFKPMKGDHDHT